MRKDDAKVRDKAFSWKITKKELAEINQEWKYGNPVPPDMRSMKLYELHEVDIDWKMLTSLRPKLQQDEDMFSRLVNRHVPLHISYFYNLSMIIKEKKFTSSTHNGNIIAHSSLLILLYRWR